MSATKSLSPREERLALAWLSNGQRGQEAAIAAGFSARTAKEQAYQVLQRPHVKAFIETRLKRTLSKLDVTVERVLTERARLAFFDPRKLFREDGKPIPLHELDEDTARAIAGLKLETIVVGRGKAKRTVTTVGEYKLPNKGENLTALDKYLGLYREEASNVGVLNIHLHLD